MQGHVIMHFAMFFASFMIDTSHYQENTPGYKLQQIDYFGFYVHRLSHLTTGCLILGSVHLKQNKWEILANCLNVLTPVTYGLPLLYV